MIDSEQWYQVVDPEELRFFLDVGRALRFVSWNHFEVKDVDSSTH
jgi:hypothetical protein